MLPFTNPRAIGYIPQFLSESDPRPAVEQLHDNYRHGGGWNDFKGFTLGRDPSGMYTLSYPSDPVYTELARGTLRDELIIVFKFAWVAVIQPDGSYRVSRMD